MSSRGWSCFNQVLVSFNELNLSSSSDTSSTHWWPFRGSFHDFTLSFPSPNNSNTLSKNKVLWLVIDSLWTKMEIVDSSARARTEATSRLNVSSPFEKMSSMSQRKQLLILRVTVPHLQCTHLRVALIYGTTPAEIGLLRGAPHLNTFEYSAQTSSAKLRGFLSEVSLTCKQK